MNKIEYRTEIGDGQNLEPLAATSLFLVVNIDWDRLWVVWVEIL